MELPQLDQNLKRGINFTSHHLPPSNSPSQLSWWQQSRHYKLMISFLIILISLNLFINLPIFYHNAATSYSSTALYLIAELFRNLNLLKPLEFFQILTILSQIAAPMCFYFFVRRNVHKNELTAFLATLLYILPNPLFQGNLPFATAIAGADGAHALTFSIIPAVLLFFQDYLSTGKSGYGVLTTILSALIAIISPFGAFNLGLIFAAILIGEIFMGQVRAKLNRFLFVALTSILLSIFWFFPDNSFQSIFLSQLNTLFSKITPSLPLLIPTIPVLGTILYLILDRKRNLVPIFMGLLILIVYFVLYLSSQKINMVGIFTPSRYIMEVSFAASFFIAVLITPIAVYLTHEFITKYRGKVVFTLLFLISLEAFSFFGNASLLSVKSAQAKLTYQSIDYNLTLKNFNVVPSSQTFLLGSSISFFVFLFLVYTLLKPHLSIHYRPQTISQESI